MREWGNENKSWGLQASNPAPTNAPVAYAQPPAKATCPDAPSEESKKRERLHKLLSLNSTTISQVGSRAAASQKKWRLLLG